NRPGESVAWDATPERRLCADVQRTARSPRAPLRRALLGVRDRSRSAPRGELSLRPGEPGPSRPVREARRLAVEWMPGSRRSVGQSPFGDCPCGPYSGTVPSGTVPIDGSVPRPAVQVEDEVELRAMRVVVVELHPAA